jgi:hypothetical protein
VAPPPDEDLAFGTRLAIRVWIGVATTMLFVAGFVYLCSWLFPTMNLSQAQAACVTMCGGFDKIEAFHEQGFHNTQCTCRREE